jgi:3-deoxy-7-phosphoheptulonate synthase
MTSLRRAGSTPEMRRNRHLDNGAFSTHTQGDRMSWAPDSWRALPIHQQPQYANRSAVEAAVSAVRSLPPLVHPGEVNTLRRRLAAAARGERFLLQGGDCAERFQDCSRTAIESKLKILLQMSLVLTWGARTPVVRVGRIAGQYAKPRSSPTEVVEGVEYPSYRGDHVNTHDLSGREPDPDRLVRAYFHSASTLNYVRALLDGGFADLHHPQDWDLGFISQPERRADYEDMKERIIRALEFMEAVGVRGGPTLRTVELYSSHEGLLLAYEEAQTEKVGDDWYNLGAHLLWIGDRTRQLDGGHVEYFRGIANPLGVKCGPTLAPDDLVALLETLDPNHTPGRITLITRYGAHRIADLLPGHIEAVQRTGRQVLWSCDPMHGNTTKTGTGFKTRDFEQILAELRQAFEIHEAMGGHLGGVHFELTADDVTECVGGPQGLSEGDLGRSYETFCDPRLNYAQSVEMAFLIARRLERRRAGRSTS